MSKPNGKKYDEEIYLALNKEDLILVGIYLISEKGERSTFERLVAECFINFPKVFSFKRYPQWPDSLRFDRDLRTVREKGLAVGSAKDYFSLTDFGKQKAIDAMKKLDKAWAINKQKKKIIPVRSADDKLVEYLKNSYHFRSYLRNPTDFSISELEFRRLLRCTLETPLRVLKQNLQYYKKIAKYYNEKELFDFLTYGENRFIKGG